MKTIIPNYFDKVYESKRKQATYPFFLLLIFLSTFFIPLRSIAQCDPCTTDTPLAIETVVSSALGLPGLNDDYDKVAVGSTNTLYTRYSDNLLEYDGSIGGITLGSTGNNPIISKMNSGDFKIFITQDNCILRSLNPEPLTSDWSTTLSRTGGSACGSDALASSPVFHSLSNASISFQNQYSHDVVYAGTRYGCADGTTDNRVYALNAETGNYLWVFNEFGTIDMDVVLGTPHLDVETDRLFVSTDRSSSPSQHTLFCIDVITRTLDWSSDVGAQWVGPVVLGDRVYVVGLNGTITVLDKSTGTELWTLSNGGIPVVLQHSVALAPNGDIIIAITDFNGNVAMARDDGNSGSWLWNVTMPDTASTAPHFSPLNDKVYFGTRAGKVEQRDALTGSLDTTRTVDLSGWVTGLDIHNFEGVSSLFSTTDIGVISKHCIPFRTPSSPSIDSDGDGVFDYCDVDDDNDGIYDIEELGDTDGDNLPDFIDPDSDNDGCFDAVEAGGTDPNGDAFLGDVPIITDSQGKVLVAGGYFPPGMAFRDTTDYSLCCSDDLSVLDLCAVVQADPSSILALGDCDKDGGSNILECNNNSDPTDAFITSWDIDPSDIVTIPLQSGTYNFTFHWTLISDPSIQISGTHTNADGDFVTNFVESGIYCLAITGEFPHLKGYPADKLLDVIQWGDIFWLSAEDMFRGWNGTSFTAADIPNLSLATSMKCMFHTAINFIGDINLWDVSSICNMSGLFAHATQFNVDLSSWNVSNAESMDTMFLNADNFNQNISVWDIGNVLTIMGMFKDADAFNQPIGEWDITHVADLSQLLENTNDFNQSLENWIFVPSMNLTDIFEKAKGLDCQNFSSTLMGWNYANPDIINKDLGNSGSIEYDQYAMTAVSEMQARGWTVPGTVTLIDCVPLNVKYWTGDQGDNWNHQTNWNPSFVPINGDQVIIPKRINYPIIKLNTANLKSVQILKDARIEIDPAGTLNLID
jgi:outer membrane protein assembly factor BamB